MVRGHRIDISEETIRRVRFGPNYTAPRHTAEHDRRIFNLQQAVTHKDRLARTALLGWIAELVTDGGMAPEWVTDHSKRIKKSQLSFPAKFWWLVIRSWIRPTMADNDVTLERAVLLASVLAGYEIDLARVIADHLHESAFHFSTSLPFPVMIHKLCRESRV